MESVPLAVGYEGFVLDTLEVELSRFHEEHSYINSLTVVRATVIELSVVQQHEESYWEVSLSSNLDIDVVQRAV
ncbi:MAG: hypothetical protein IIY21_26210 [Clostridiales bacterium]|nr:hypothetical protein [Clostridiales bacterium]